MERVNLTSRTIEDVCNYIIGEMQKSGNRKGNRIETVELDLTQGKVIQSRGVCNSNTEYHDRIINLVNTNAYRFMQAKASA